jgi:hypothetical protein
MKLVILTAVESYQKDIYKLFKKVILKVIVVLKLKDLKIIIRF